SQLFSLDILVSDPRFGKDATPVSLPVPRFALSGEYEVADVSPLRWSEIVQFTLAAIYALSLSLLSTKTAYAVLSRRHISARSTTSTDDMKIAARNFLRLRPLLFRTRNPLWTERIALLEFLRLRGHPCTLVLGVAVDPPSTHYWVQVDEI